MRTTRSQSRYRPSTEAALRIPEILISILQYLDISTLLCNAQLTSKRWHTTIANSVSLQQKMYFISYPADCAPILNPILMVKFPAWFGLQPQERERESSFDQLEWRRAGKAYKYKNASWRRMLLIQPSLPEQELRVTSESSGMMGVLSRVGTVDMGKETEREAGVRMGLVLLHLIGGGCQRYPWNPVIGLVERPNWKFDALQKDNANSESGGWDGAVKIMLMGGFTCCDEDESEDALDFKSEAYKEVNVEWDPKKEKHIMWD